MSKQIKVTATIELDPHSKAAKEWADVDDYVTSEVSEALDDINARFQYGWNPEDAGNLDSGTKWKFETAHVTIPNKIKPTPCN